MLLPGSRESGWLGNSKETGCGSVREIKLSRQSLQVDRPPVKMVTRTEQTSVTKRLL